MVFSAEDEAGVSGHPLSWRRRGVPFETTGVTGDEHRRSVAVSYDQIRRQFKSGGFGRDRGRGRGSGRSRDGSERVQRDAMVDVTLESERSASNLHLVSELRSIKGGFESRFQDKLLVRRSCVCNLWSFVRDKSLTDGGLIGKRVGNVLQQKTEAIRCFGTSIVVEETGSTVRDDGGDR
ncbi:hypothetical protein Tco_0870875 [Tanacetum coccineum]